MSEERPWLAQGRAIQAVQMLDGITKCLLACWAPGRGCGPRYFLRETYVLHAIITHLQDLYNFSLLLPK